MKSSRTLVLQSEKHNLGAFFASQKTGLCGAPRVRAPAPTFGRKRPNAVAASHPYNPLRSDGVRRAATDCIQAPPRGEHYPHDQHMVTDFELIFFEWNHYNE
jgi:hypothetical protein